MVDFGDYLYSKSKFEESALAFSNSGDDAKALTAFKAAGDWRMAVLTAIKLSLNQKEIAQLGYELSESLSTMSKFSEAAEILIECCNDVEQAVTSLISGNQWQEALRRVPITFYEVH